MYNHGTALHLVVLNSLDVIVLDINVADRFFRAPYGIDGTDSSPWDETPAAYSGGVIRLQICWFSWTTCPLSLKTKSYRLIAYSKTRQRPMPYCLPIGLCLPSDVTLAPPLFVPHCCISGRDTANPQACETLPLIFCHDSGCLP